MENEDIGNKVEGYLKLLDDIREKTGDELLAGRILSEIAKDRRMEQIKNERNGQQQQPATKKQKRYLKRLGVKIQEGLTKKKASQLIDEAIDDEE